MYDVFLMRIQRRNLARVGRAVLQIQPAARDRRSTTQNAELDVTSSQARCTPSVASGAKPILFFDASR
jgi:hypothetical protein